MAKIRFYRPVKSDFIFQKFGENLACAAADADGKPLVPYQVLKNSYPGTCPAGSVKLYPLLGLIGHNGYDLSAWHGEPCFHAADYAGWIKSEIDSQGGVGVDVVSNEPIKECTEGCPAGTMHYIKLRNWHLRNVVGYDKQQVKMGALVGNCDNTGISAGDHDHWAPKWCDKEGNGIHTDNGYYGAFDPTPDFENTFVLDALAVQQQALTAIELARKLIFQVIQFLKGRNNT